MRNKEKSAGGPWKLLLISVCVLLWSEVNGEVKGYVEVKTDSTFCNGSNNNLICDLENKRGRIGERQWTGEWNIFKVYNAKGLNIQSQCNAMDKRIEVYESTGIFSENLKGSTVTNCSVNLRLENCTAGLLSEIFNLINIKSSIVDSIKLDVKQFDIMHGSKVGELDVTSRESKSTVLDSTVDVVRKMELVGAHTLEIANSVLGEIQKIIYNTSASDSKISYTEIGSISGGGGFEMTNGGLVFDNVKFNSLSHKSIIVSGGMMHLKNTTIARASTTSIVLRAGAKVKFDNVVLGDSSPYSFEIIAGNEDVWPLSIVYLELQSPAWVTNSIFFIVGLAVGVILVLVILHFCKCCPSPFANNKGKKNEQYPLTSVSPHSRDSYPPPPTPLVEHTVKDTEEEDDYDEVCRETQPKPSHLQPRINVSNPMNIPTLQDQNYPPVPGLPAPLPGHENQHQMRGDDNLSAAKDPEFDDDDEPIYDECENYQVGHPPLPPPPASFTPNKPLVATKKPNISNNQKNTPPVLNRYPLTSDSNDSTIDPPKGHQMPLLPKPGGLKTSFLHTGSKPPPPPRTTNTIMNPPGGKPPGIGGPVHGMGQGLGRPAYSPRPASEELYDSVDT